MFIVTRTHAGKRLPVAVTRGLPRAAELARRHDGCENTPGVYEVLEVLGTRPVKLKRPK